MEMGVIPAIVNMLSSINSVTTYTQILKECSATEDDGQSPFQSAIDVVQLYIYVFLDFDSFDSDDISLCTLAIRLLYALVCNSGHSESGVLSKAQIKPTVSGKMKIPSKSFWIPEQSKEFWKFDLKICLMMRIS